jgi:hypothetical protein
LWCKRLDFIFQDGRWHFSNTSWYHPITTLSVCMKANLTNRVRSRWSIAFQSLAATGRVGAAQLQFEAAKAGFSSERVARSKSRVRTRISCSWVLKGNFEIWLILARALLVFYLCFPLYWIEISLDFKRLFYVKKFYWYSIKTFIKSKGWQKYSYPQWTRSR